jgi:hypothetical protein
MAAVVVLDKQAVLAVLVVVVQGGLELLAFLALAERQTLVAAAGAAAQTFLAHLEALGLLFYLYRQLDILAQQQARPQLPQVVPTQL